MAAQLEEGGAAAPVAVDESDRKTVNINVGILGHVDSGKTSLARVLSTVVSTAALDKHPQSRTRGITLDLGFSSLVHPAPQRFVDALGCENVQLTFVDCPGHASLIRTIIGGAQIIDMMILVIDAKKGIQTQTAECLVIGEVLVNSMIVVLNKIDLFPAETRAENVEKVTKKLRTVFAGTKFGANVRIVPVAADEGAAGIAATQVSSMNVQDVIAALLESAPVPSRSLGKDFFFAVDHCFPIKGQGTVLTGTVLSGSVAVGQNVELPELRLQRKIKSMQMFKKPVNDAKQGDRVALCVTQFDSEAMERPGNKGPFSIDSDFKWVDALDDAGEGETDAPLWAFLDFEKPVICQKQSLYIASRLDTDQGGTACRIAFYGHLQHIMNGKDDIHKLKVFKIKERKGSVMRVPDAYSVIVKNIFSKESHLDKFLGLKVSIEGAAAAAAGTNPVPVGVLEGGFGKSGAVKAYFSNGHGLPISAKKGKNAKDDDEEEEGGGGAAAGGAAGGGGGKGRVEVVMRLKKYCFALKGPTTKLLQP